jgi:SH3-like domain-containing protein
MPPDASAPGATNAPAKVKKTVHKKKVVKKPATSKTAAGIETGAPANPPVANEPAEAIKNEVNVRGQAHINSEVVGHLKRGDTVTVLEIVTLPHPKTDEPANWARIALPTAMHVWVNTPYLEASSQAVKARKLNMRTGPGENFSVIGLLTKGEAVKPIGTKGAWTEIEAPTNAFGFVAAHLLAHKEAAPVLVATQPPMVPPPAPMPTPTLLENPGTIAPPAGETPGGTAPPPTANPVAAPPIPTPLPPIEEPLPKRIVEREGVVGGTVSIQAPSHFELRSLDNGRVMDYLYTTSTNLVLKNYKGLTVLVSGEEELDERWPNTPVVTIQKIQVVK